VSALREAVLAKLVRARAALDELRRRGGADMGSTEWETEWQKGYIKALEEILDFDGVTLRRFPRRPTSIPAELARGLAAGAGERAGGTITDLSLGGCALATALGLSVGEAIEVSFTLPGRAAPVTVEGTVRRAQRLGDDVRAGVEFKSFPPDVSGALDAFLALPPPDR